MPEKFSDEASAVVVHAEAFARRFNHNYVGTEHLLAALVYNTEAAPGRALALLNVRLPNVLRLINDYIGQGKHGSSKPLPFTPRIKSVFELALREALGLGSDNIRPEHLLLGILRDFKEGNASVAMQILVSGHNLLPEQIRSAANASLANDVEEPTVASPTPSPGPAMVVEIEMPRGMSGSYSLALLSSVPVSREGAAEFVAWFRGLSESERKDHPLTGFFMEVESRIIQSEG